MAERLKQLGSILLLTALAAAVAVGFSLKAYNGFHDATVAKDWPVADAVVVDRSMVDEVFDRQPRVTVTVEFDYTVDGIGYSGVEKRDQVSVGEGDELYDPYPIDHQFSLHYNPDDPAESAFDVSLRGNTFLYLIIAIFGVIGTLVMLYTFVDACKNGGNFYIASCYFGYGSVFMC